MDTLGEDLLLLSIRKPGRVATKHSIGFGLMGSELVRLAAAGRVDIREDRIIVRDPGPTGDRELDAALATLAARRPPRAKDWVGSPRRKILDAYLDRLAGAGVLQRDTGGIFPVTRWTIADPGRLATAQARLDAIARGTGPVDTGQAAFASLATAIGLGQLLYPGWRGRAERKRLKEAGEGQLTRLAGVQDAPRPELPAGPVPGTAAGDAAAAAAAASDAAQSAHHSPAQHPPAHPAGQQHSGSHGSPAGLGAAHAAAAAGASAAVQAATAAAVAGAVHAATQAATAAAVHAATSAAASHAGGHAGGSVGGHH